MSYTPSYTTGRIQPSTSSRNTSFLQTRVQCIFIYATYTYYYEMMLTGTTTECKVGADSVLESRALDNITQSSKHKSLLIDHAYIHTI